MEGASVDCIFLSCTNWQAIDAIAAVKARFGVPVITSNQATIEAVRQAALGSGGSHLAAKVPAESQPL